MSGWGDIDKKDGKRGSLSGRFVQFEDGVSVRLRVLDEEPHTTRVHKITQLVKKGDKTEEVFRSIPATESPDENFILKNAPNNRYPDVMQFNLRVWQYTKDDKGKDTDEGELKILQGGPAIFKPLRDIYTENGSLGQFDIIIKRTGKARDTEYTVSAAPFSKKVDVDALRTALEADEALSSWDAIFPPVTAAQQEEMVKQAGFDIGFDPAAALAATMTPDDARSVTFTFGKYKGKTVGELMITDAGYVEWAAANVTSNDALAAACRVAVGDMAQISSGQSATPAALPPAKEKTKAKEKPAPAAKAEPSVDRDALLEEVNDRLEQDPRFEDIEVMVNLIKKHSGGKTRVKDLTTAQLTALHAELANG